MKKENQNAVTASTQQPESISQHEMDSAFHAETYGNLHFAESDFTDAR